MKTFQNKVAVITGAASGMGKGTALALAERGCHVVIADLHDERASETVGEAKQLGVEAIAIHCDVANQAHVNLLYQGTMDHFGRIDILMNNAGILPIGSFLDTPLSEWERTLNINFLSVVRVTQAFLSDLLKSGDGHIVNTASLAGLYAYEPNSLAYNASKAALISLSEGLALDLRSKNVGVTCLCPGPVATNIAEQIRVHGSNPVVGQSAAAQFQSRTPGEVGEMVVAAILENRFLLPTNGEVLDILRARSADPEAFLDQQIKAYNIG